MCPATSSSQRGYVLPVSVPVRGLVTQEAGCSGAIYSRQFQLPSNDSRYLIRFGFEKHHVLNSNGEGVHLAPGTRPETEIKVRTK
jgi:hypothetical protein